MRNHKQQKGYAFGGLLVAFTILIIIGGGAYFVLKKNISATQELPMPLSPIPAPPASSTFTGPLSNPEPHPQANTPQTPQKKCVISGCSGEICADEERISTCIYKPEFACYKQATCELQADNRCGWTQTPELKACLTKNQSVALPPAIPNAPVLPPADGPTPQQTTPTPIPQTVVPPSPRSFNLIADDAGFYYDELPINRIGVEKGAVVNITFKVFAHRVYYGGLDFRSDHFPTTAALPGQSATVTFTADKSFIITSYWPSSGVRKADISVQVK